ncbi:MAG: hypothetical protein WBZ01_19460 [Terriglobales bacterium]|jgi:hypothetical protein
MKPDTGERELVFKLLQENSTLGQVAQYLKRKGLHYSAGSWDELFGKRVSKAIEGQELTREDLIELIRLSEEYGTQHVFLYVTKPRRAKKLVDRGRVEAELSKMGFSSLMGSPRILDQPSSPTITDVRVDESLVAKVVERRTYQRFVDQRIEGDFLVRRYRELTVRAVNLFRLSDDGILELRIYTHDNSSDYRNDVTKMWNLLGFLFPPSDFRELPIGKAKTNLWKKRNSLKTVIRYSDSTLRNALGTALSASTGSEQQSLFDDQGASSSLDEFLKHRAYCDTSNVWWLRGGGRQSENEFDVLPSKDVHVLLKGDRTDFLYQVEC